MKHQDPTHLGYEDEADGECGSEEGEERGEGVGGVDLLFDHERRRHADQAQYDHVVHAYSCNHTVLSIDRLITELRFSHSKMVTLAHTRLGLPSVGSRS